MRKLIIDLSGSASLRYMLSILRPAARTGYRDYSFCRWRLRLQLPSQPGLLLAADGSVAAGACVAGAPPHAASSMDDTTSSTMTTQIEDLSFRISTSSDRVRCPA
jgi:hypothetical protein